MTSRSEQPKFTVEGVTFVCFVVDGGRYEWRSTCGGAMAGRDVRTYWARTQDRDLGNGYASLKAAMTSAARALAVSKVRAS